MIYSRLLLLISFQLQLFERILHLIFATHRCILHKPRPGIVCGKTMTHYFIALMLAFRSQLLMQRFSKFRIQEKVCLIVKSHGTTSVYILQRNFPNDVQRMLNLLSFIHSLLSTSCFVKDYLYSKGIKSFGNGKVLNYSLFGQN